MLLHSVIKDSANTFGRKEHLRQVIFDLANVARTLSRVCHSANRGSCLWIGLRNPTCVESLRVCTRARTFIYVLYDTIMLHMFYGHVLYELRSFLVAEIIRYVLTVPLNEFCAIYLLIWNVHSESKI